MGKENFYPLPRQRLGLGIYSLPDSPRHKLEGVYGSGTPRDTPSAAAAVRMSSMYAHLTALQMFSSNVHQFSLQMFSSYVRLSAVQMSSFYVYLVVSLSAHFPSSETTINSLIQRGKLFSGYLHPLPILPPHLHSDRLF